MIEVSLHRLTEFAWSAPIRDLAPKLNLSDVGLRKILKGHGVNLPPQGYWLAKQPTEMVLGLQKIPPRRPGQSQRIHLDSRFETVLTPDAPLDPDGPFESALVPEDLESLRALEVKAIGYVRVPLRLGNPNPGLHALLKKEELRRIKITSGQHAWRSDGPLFDNVVDQRQLRLLNAILFALSKREVHAKVHLEEYNFHAIATVGDFTVSFTMIPATKPKNLIQYAYAETMTKLPPRSRVVVMINPSRSGTSGDIWQDDAEGQLETKIPSIAAAVIVAGETAFRQNVRMRAEWRAQREREEEIEARRRQLQEQQEILRREAEAEAKRLADLKLSGKLLREANELRDLVAVVREKMNANPDLAEKYDIAEWENWATDYADRIDPIKSGQVLSHLKSLHKS